MFVIRLRFTPTIWRAGLSERLREMGTEELIMFLLPNFTSSCSPIDLLKLAAYAVPSRGTTYVLVRDLQYSKYARINGSTPIIAAAGRSRACAGARARLPAGACIREYTYRAVLVPEPRIVPAAAPVATYAAVAAGAKPRSEQSPYRVYIRILPSDVHGGARVVRGRAAGEFLFGQRR